MTFSNYDFLTVEDYNTIVAKYGENYNDLYTMDVMELYSLANHGVNTYDFLRIFRDGEYLRISVENSLWQGEIKILECTMSEGWGTRPSMVQYGDQGFRITMSGVESLTIGLIFTNKTSFRFYVNELRVDGVQDMIVPYLLQPSLRLRVMDGETPVQNADVTIFRTDNWMLVDWKHTDANGYCTVNLLGMNSPQLFTYKINTKYGSKDSEDYFKVNYTRISAKPLLLSNILYRDTLNTVLFEFLFDSTFNIPYHSLFEGNNIKVYANNKLVSAELFGEEYETYYMAGVDLRGYTRDTVEIKIIGEGNSFIHPFTVEFTVPVEQYTVSSFEELQAFCESPNKGTAKIIAPIEFRTGIIIPSDAECKIIDTIGEHTVNDGVDSLFRVYGDLTLEGLQIEDTRACIICQYENSKVNMSDCRFTRVYPDNNEHNSILYCYTSADSIQSRELFRTIVNNCEFKDCPACISHSGILEINDTLFDMEYMADWFENDEYKYRTSPFGVYQQYGELKLNNNRILFDFGDNIISNPLYGHLFVWLGTKTIINTMQSVQTQSQNTFPLQNNYSTVKVKYSQDDEIIRILPEPGFDIRAILWTVEDTGKLFNNHTLIISEETG